MAKKKRNSSSRPGSAALPGGNGLGSPGSLSPSVSGAGAAGGAFPSGGSRAQPQGRARPAAAPAVSRQALALPDEVVRNDWTAILFTIMMFLAPALGVPHEEMLQDTLKSIVVSFIALAAGLAFFWHQRNRREGLRWHVLMWFPLALMAYALGSMAWSHTYLAGVEAIRWFIFALILWLTLNCVNRERFPAIALGIHCGAVVAALWGALQFWVNFSYFPQGPNPASTFVNRNFLAEYLVCALPFAVYLLLRARQTGTIVLLSLSLGFEIVVLMMTAPRSALLAAAMSAAVLPFIAWRYRAQLSFVRWDSGRRILAMGVLLATVVGLGLISSGNPKPELSGYNAFQRAFSRASAMASAYEYTAGSFSVRLVMWKATLRLIEKRPLSGVGAGAWEVDMPLYQTEGSQLETDYYVHNEILQLLAEYGLVGWIALLFLLGYLVVAAWRTLRDRSPDGMEEGLLRGIALTSLLMLLVVSNAGFAWRMASTGAIFALCLGFIAASDARRQFARVGAQRLPWRPAYSQIGAVVSMLCLALAAYITQQAAECESKIVKAVKIALTVSSSGDPNNPRWDKPKAEMLKLIREGVAINPHYRKITPMVADEMAKWGDWRNAVWVWESVVGSRPYVTAIMSNIARGYAQIGNNEKAFEYLRKSKKIQPNAPSVRSLEVILLSRTGQEKLATDMARTYFRDGQYDYDLTNAGYILGVRSRDWALAIKAMELRNKDWPAQAADGWMKIAQVYSAELKDEGKALAAYKAALEASPEKDRPALKASMPPAYQAKL